MITKYTFRKYFCKKKLHIYTDSLIKKLIYNAGLFLRHIQDEENRINNTNNEKNFKYKLLSKCSVFINMTMRYLKYAIKFN